MESDAGGAPRDNRAARLLAGRGGGGGLEGGGLESGGADLAADMLGKLDRALAHNVVEDPRTPLGRTEAAAFHDSARAILARLGAEGPDLATTPADEMVLEAIIHADGTRPALLIQDGFVTVTDPALQPWVGSVMANEDAIRAVIAATGRVLRHGKTDDANVFGTAWMVGPGLVATAQHVVEEMAVFDFPTGKWLLKQGFTVDFAVESGRPANLSSRFRVAAIERPGPDRINGTMNLANLDAAVLRLEPNDLADMPAPIALAAAVPGPDTELRLYVLGHPRRLEGAWVAETEAEAGQTRVFRGVLEALLGHDFGVKRFSPGDLEIGLDGLPGDVHKRVFSHDATTLGGNSGGPVLDFAGTADRAIGLHFGGRFRERNFALSVPRIAGHLTGAGV